MINALIAIDLDGTLLDAKGTYSPRTRDYLRTLTKRGYAIVLASGRPFRAMERIYEDLHCEAPLIAYNGSYVFQPNDASFRPFEVSFPKESVRRIFDRSRPYAFSFMAESKTRIYIDQDDPFLDRYFPYAGMDVIRGPLSERVDEDVFTMLFSAPLEQSDRLKADCEAEENISWRPWSNSTYSELFIPTAHKGTALDYIAQQLHVAKEDIYAIGDAENDIPMLDAAGHPFAMKNNRVPHLMARFPQTKNSVDEDGVLETLVSLFGD